MNKLELIEVCRRLDEITLLELLEITSDDLVDAFIDKIEDNLSRIYAKIREEQEEG